MSAGNEREFIDHLQTIEGGKSEMTMECLYCLGVAEKTDWRPPEGFDHFVRQFKCRDCHKYSYKRLTRGQLKIEREED